MKKILYFFVFFISFYAFSQSKYTAEQVENSNDPQVIANFIKFNPNHPKTPGFKQKLAAAVLGNKTPSQQAAVAKPAVTPLKTEKLEAAVKRDVAKDGSNDKHKRTADLLNHLFNSDASSREAYIQIVNKSKCNLIVKISGKRFYNLDVPANNQNFLLIDKGSYTITTMMCDVQYSSVKNISKDVVITLNAPK